MDALEQTQRKARLFSSEMRLSLLSLRKSPGSLIRYNFGKNHLKTRLFPNDIVSLLLKPMPLVSYTWQSFDALFSSLPLADSPQRDLQITAYK